MDSNNNLKNAAELVKIADEMIENAVMTEKTKAFVRECLATALKIIKNNMPKESQ